MKKQDLCLPLLLFFCDAKTEMTQTHMTESEIEKGFHLEWATAQEIIDGNEPFCETQPWSFRDREFVKMLVEKRFSPHSFTNNLHREEVCIYMPLLSCRKVEIRIG